MPLAWNRSRTACVSLWYISGMMMTPLGIQERVFEIFSYLHHTPLRFPDALDTLENHIKSVKGINSIKKIKKSRVSTRSRASIM
jgi:hypothetical protein